MLSPSRTPTRLVRSCLRVGSPDLIGRANAPFLFGGGGFPPRTRNPPPLERVGRNLKVNPRSMDVRGGGPNGALELARWPGSLPGEAPCPQKVLTFVGRPLDVGEADRPNFNPRTALRCSLSHPSMESADDCGARRSAAYITR